MALSDDIVSALPEEYRGHEIVKNATDVASVVKMAIDGQKELGGRIRVPGPDAGAEALAAFQKDLAAKVPNLTMIPGEGATDEQRNAFFQQLGRPAEPAQYKLDGVTMPEGLPEGFELPAEQLENFKKFAFENNLTQSQFEAALGAELQAFAGQSKAQADAKAAREAKLKEAFGAAEEAKRNAALRAAEKYGGPEFKAQLEASGTPEQWLAWAKAGEAFAESGSLSLTGQGPQSGILAPAEAQRRLQEIQRNADHPYHKSTRAGHQDAVFEAFNLRLQAMGDKPLTRAAFDAQFGNRGHGGKFGSQQLGTTVAEVGG